FLLSEVLRNGDRENLSARPEEPYFNLWHAAARNAFDERGYTARVQSPRGSGDPQGVLRGAAIASASSIMIIAQVSDTHLELNTPDADQRIRDFERTIAAINCLDPAPEVNVQSEHIVQNGRGEKYVGNPSIPV